MALPVLAPEWFQNSFLGIELEQFIGIAVLGFTVVAIRIGLAIISNAYIRHRVIPANQPFWLREQKRLHRPTLLLLIAVTMLVGFPVLDFDPDIEDIVKTIARLLSTASAVLFGFRAIDVLADWMARRAARTSSKLDDQLIPLLRTGLKIFVSIVGVLFILQNLNVNVASLIAGVGIGGLAIALAAQDTIKNLLGGVTIFSDKPFRIGDWVIIGNVEGTVEEVGFRSTRIRTFANSLVTVPNARMTDTDVDNMGIRRWRRYKTTLGLDYRSTTNQVQAFVEGVRAIIRANPQMRKDYYMVEFHGFGPSSLDILVYCFIDAPTWNAELRTRHVLNLDIMRLAEQIKVEFAFPTQTIRITETPDQSLPIPEIPSRQSLGNTIAEFGPKGTAGQRTDSPITDGYDNE